MTENSGDGRVNQEGDSTGEAVVRQILRDISYYYKENLLYLIGNNKTIRILKQSN